MSEPFNKLTAIPSTVLHRIADPAQIFYSNDGVTPQVGEVSYLLRRENGKFAFLAGSCLTVKLCFVKS